MNLLGGVRQEDLEKGSGFRFQGSGKNGSLLMTPTSASRAASVTSVNRCLVYLIPDT
jgi:hypothetical protein